VTSIALLIALLATPPADPPLRVGMDFEAATRALGCFALWGDGEVVGSAEYPATPGYVDVGPVLDAGGVPFRTWVTLDFDRAAFAILDGDFGVGFTPRIRLPAGTVPEGASVGAAGTVGFEGTIEVTLRGTNTSERRPVGFSRGFERAPAGKGAEPHASWSGVVPVRAEGSRGLYRWFVRGDLTVDLHVYTASPPP